MQFRKICPIQDSTVQRKNIRIFIHSRKPSGLLSNMTPCNAQCAQQNLHKIEKLYLQRVTDAHSDLTRPVLTITQCYSTHMMTHTATQITETLDAATTSQATVCIPVRASLCAAWMSNVCQCNIAGVISTSYNVSTLRNPLGYFVQESKHNVKFMVTCQSVRCGKCKHGWTALQYTL